MNDNSARPVELETWNRRELFTHFANVNFPFYHVAFNVDVTSLRRYAKAEGLSFYLSFIYFVSEALNEVENFRYCIRDGQVWLLDRIHPSFTSLKPGDEIFRITTCRLTDNVEEFCAKASKMIANQKGFLEEEKGTCPDGLIYISCLPWLDLTAVSNERDINPNDSIPRISWGKFVVNEGRYRLNMTVEVNHKLIDGLHIGRFYETLQSMLDQLDA